MQIRQSFEVPYPSERVWRCFGRIEAIVPCLPGASCDAPPVDGALALTMKVKLGLMVASFSGQGSMTLDEASRTGRISGAGLDRRSGSRVKGEVAFSVHEVPAATRVDIVVEYSLAGGLAQFAREGIVRALAQQLSTAFGENIKKLLASDQAAQSPPEKRSAPLDVGKLFWPTLLARIRRWLGIRE